MGTPNAVCLLRDHIVLYFHYFTLNVVKPQVLLQITQLQHASYVLKTDKLLHRPAKNACWKCLIIHTLSSKISSYNGVEFTEYGRLAALSTRFLCVTGGLWRILMRKFQPTAMPVEHRVRQRWTCWMDAVYASLQTLKKPYLTAEFLPTLIKQNLLYRRVSKHRVTFQTYIPSSCILIFLYFSFFSHFFFLYLIFSPCFLFTSVLRLLYSFLFILNLLSNLNAPLLCSFLIPPPLFWTPYS